MCKSSARKGLRFRHSSDCFDLQGGAGTPTDYHGQITIAYCTGEFRYACNPDASG
ncbi:hypothetical protein GCM10027046_17120 [Uliginosibacterium flavum]